MSECHAIIGNRPIHFTIHAVRIRKVMQRHAELGEWLSFVARTKGRTERQFNAQHPLLVMRLGPGLN